MSLNATSAELFTNVVWSDPALSELLISFVPSKIGDKEKLKNWPISLFFMIGMYI